MLPLLDLHLNFKFDGWPHQISRPNQKHIPSTVIIRTLFKHHVSDGCDFICLTWNWIVFFFLFFCRRVHISEKTLQCLNGEFEVEPAFGEKREETLRIAGLKTYFIKKVLIPVSKFYLLNQIQWPYTISERSTTAVNNRMFDIYTQICIHFLVCRREWSEKWWAKIEHIRTNRRRRPIGDIQGWGIKGNLILFTICLFLRIYS